jgi:hypothetical protein
MRLQFRVWDKKQNKMLYNNFIVRHGNDGWTQEQYDKYNEYWSENSEEYKVLQKREYSHCHAEPIETPELKIQCKLDKLMGDTSCSWSLIDWSNFRFEYWVTMQATGFHDKNGELIWEGDLLKFGELIYPVYWCFSSFVWNGQMIADFREFDSSGILIGENGYQGDVFGIQTENMEKVGNIYEHGEQYGFDRESIEAFTPSNPV